MDREVLAKEQLLVSLAAWSKKAAGAPLLSCLMGPGQPLNLDVQQRMEALFGRDLGHVRIHDTRQAGEIAKRLGAEAFTIGPRIFAAPEVLTSETAKGQALLAHELVHFVQQTQPSSIAATRSPTSGQPTSSMTQDSISPGEVAGLPYQPDKAPPQVQLAAEVPAAGPDAMESQALAVEQATREMAEDEIAGPTAMDPHEIADRVYRLMQDELRLGR